MAHIFISYSHKDTEYAHALAKNLQGMGFDVWIDERLDYGSQWPQELQKQLDSCSAFILIMSPRSYASDWVQSELQRARRKMKPIFPLLLEGDEPWLSVESTQYYDVRGEIYPDTKFYTALKNVMSSTPAGKTLKMPKGSIETKWTDRSSTLKTGIVLAILGVVLLSFIGLAAFFIPSLLDRPTNPTAVVAGQTVEVIVSDEPTSVAVSTSISQTTEPPVIANAGEHEMALVPAGEFTMGQNAADELTACQKTEPQCNIVWFQDAEPIHNIYVDSFYIDRYEVTNALYKACEEEGVCDPPQSLNSSTRTDYYGNPEFDNYPVIQVNWNQAKAYCEWRGARLPTEAEWEKAARGVDERMYPWGEDVNESLANFSYSTGDTTAVGSYENGKSPYGLYDMAGNVWEWVNSLHRPYPYVADDGRESLTSTDQDLRVARGGSWGLVGASVSASYRYGFNPTHTNLDLGFRCAMDANP